MTEQTKATIVIEIKGGLVQSVYMDPEKASDFDVKILDWDLAYCTCKADRKDQGAHNKELALLAKGMVDI